ncbi:MAG: oxidoreductase C-terminal domain-containing protein, partial [Bacteroidota bacterium]
FNSLHQQHGVHIHTSKNVTSIQSDGVSDQVLCEDKTQYEADLIILGVGIQVHLELAKQAALEIENGIKVDATCRTSDASIYAIGDCTYHHNPRYNRLIRLESVQNAVDQAKVAAAAICGRPMAYDSIPWFWSDQYDIKLQMVGLSEGYTDTVIRRKHEKSFSVWYFNQDQLLAVDAINNARAYMLGMKVLKKNISLDRQLLGDTSIPIKNAILNTT